MSSQQSGPQRELVFCHACADEWYRDEHGLVCPQCQSDVVEIIEANHDPRQEMYEEESDSTANMPTDSHFLGHPWSDSAAPDHNASDPHQGNFRVSILPNGRIIHGSFHSTLHHGSNGPQMTGGPNVQAHQIFSQLMQSIGNLTPDEAIRRGGQPNTIIHHHDLMRSPPPVPTSTRPMSSPPVPTYTRPGPTANHGQNANEPGPVIGQFRFGPITGHFAQTVTTRRIINGREVTESTTSGNPMEADADFMGILGEIFRPLAQAQARSTGGQATGAAMASPLHTLLAHLIPGGPSGRMGDYVTNNEALDRIISELMAQNPPQSTAPGPATEDAIASLPTISLTKEMIGDDRTSAECGICLSGCEIGEKVTELPCKHWFHFECVKQWLESHDSCPACRRGIMPREGDENRARSTGEAPRNWQMPNLSRSNTNDSQAGQEPSTDNAGRDPTPTPATPNDDYVSTHQSRTYRWSRSRSPTSPNNSERPTQSSSLTDSLRNGIVGWMGRHGWTTTSAAQPSSSSSGAAAAESSGRRSSNTANEDQTMRQRRTDHHGLDNPDVD